MWPFSTFEVILQFMKNYNTLITTNYDISMKYITLLYIKDFNIDLNFPRQQKKALELEKEEQKRKELEEKHR